MKKVYLVLIDKKDGLKLVAEYDSIEKCNDYLRDSRFKVIDCWRKA